MSQDCRTKHYDPDNDKNTCRFSEKAMVESPFRRSSRVKMSPGNVRIQKQVNRLEEILEEEVRNEDSKYQSTQFVLLPSHSTPPQLEKKVRNPFDGALIKRLHLPVVSPSIFRRVVSPTQDTCDFSWTIDDVAKLRPAPIEETIPEHYEQIDPELELKAQEAINHYFHNMPMVVPSPWGPGAICIKSKTESPDSDGTKNEKEDSNKEASVDAISSEKNCSSERISKHTVFLTQDTDDSAEEANLSTSTLRRKLFSQEQEETEDVLPLRLSCFPMQLECTKHSPLRSGKLFTSSKIVCSTTPISKEQRFGTPITKCKEIIDSPEVSPIQSPVFSSQPFLMNKTRMKSHSPCSSPIGASPLNCYEGTVSMVDQWENEDRSMASFHASYSAMITSGTSTPTKSSSTHGLFSLTKSNSKFIGEKAEKASEDDDVLTNHATEYQGIYINKGTHSAFSSTPIKKVPQGGLFSVENMDLSNFKNPLKKENGYQSDEEEMLSLSSQDTGYQTGYINSGGVSSAFSSLNNWSSMQQSQVPLKTENYEKLLYSVSKSTTAVEENSLWKPGCKYIISSTPTKVTGY